MTFNDALLFIKINGEYHKNGKITFKLKIAPENYLDSMRFQFDVLSKKIITTNEDAKKYTVDDKFIIIPYDTSFLFGEN